MSHETIYRSLFIQARGVLKKELMDHLRSKRRMRRSRHANRQRAVTRSDRRCHIDPRKTCGSGRPSGSWSLGRRSAERRKEQLHRDTGRTPFTIRHADQSAEQRNRSCRCCLESARSQTPRYAETLADVGSRTGDGETQGLHGSYRCAGLFLRSAKPLAARHERKHQPSFTAILPTRHRPVWLFSSTAQPGRAALESTPEKDFRISDSCE